MTNKRDVKTTFKEKRKTKYFFIKHHGDLIFLFIVLVLFSLGFAFTYCESWNKWLTCFYTLNPYNDLVEDKNIIEFITIIIPTLITIITLGISIPDTEIYGLHYSDFRRIRGDYEYSLLCMILISIFVLLLSLISNIIQFFWTTITLNAISLTYCIIFLCKEMPILSKKDNVLFHLIRKSNHILMKEDSKSKGNKVTYVTRRKDYLTQVKTYLLFSVGINKTYRILYVDSKHRKWSISENEYQKTLLTELINLQDNYLTELHKNFRLLSQASDGTFKGIAISDAIAWSVDNLYKIFLDNDEVSLLEILNSSQNLVPLTNMFFAIYRALKKTNLLECYKKDFDEIIRLVTPTYYVGDVNSLTANPSVDEMCDNYKMKISTALAMASLDNNDMWYFNFLKEIKDNTDFTNHHRKIDDEFLVFTSLCLFYKHENNKRKPIGKEITEFYDAKWKKDIEKILKTYQKLSFNEKTLLLDKFISIYNISDDTYMSNKYTLGDILNGKNSLSLNISYIVMYWVNFISNDELIDDKNHTEFNSIINKYCCPKSPYDPFYSLSFEEDSIEYYIKHFATYFKLYNVSLKEQAKDYFEKIDLNNESISNKEGESSESEEKKSIEKRIALMNDYFGTYRPETNATLTEYVLCNGCEFEKNEIELYLDPTHRLNVLGDLLSENIDKIYFSKKQKITVESFRDFPIDDYIKNSNDFNVILPGNYRYRQDHYSEWKEKFGNRILDLVWSQNYGLAFTKDSIKFYCELSKFECRDLTDAQLEAYISSHCQLNNGLYRYDSADESLVYYSRSALRKKVKNDIKIYDITIKYKFVFKKDKSNKISYIDPRIESQKDSNTHA